MSTNARSVSIPPGFDLQLLVDAAKPRIGQLRFNHVGGMVGLMLHGITICQTLWYYRSYGNDPWTLKATVALVFLADVAHNTLSLAIVWYYLIRRDFLSDLRAFLYCAHWTMNAQLIPAEIIRVITEGFLLWRVYQLTRWKSALAIGHCAILASIGLVTSFSVVRFRHPCTFENQYAQLPFNICMITVSIFDLLLSGITCVVLYNNRPGLSVTGNTVRVIKVLIRWSIVNGLLVAAFTVATTVVYNLYTSELYYFCIYLVRARIYSNTFLAALNSRRVLRLIADQPLELETIHMTEDSRMRSASVI